MQENALCRKRTGDAVPQAKNFGDMITADHRVLSERCEYRSDHQYAVVLQDLVCRWLQSYPCKAKSSHGTERSSRKFLEPTDKPKVIESYDSLEFGKACEELSWNHCTSTPHRSETNGFAERAVRRIKEGTSAVQLQSGFDEKWWADSVECACSLRNVEELSCTSYSRTNDYVTLRINGYDTAYTFTQNNITLEHNAMNNMNNITHMDAHNTQY